MHSPSSGERTGNSPNRVSSVVLEPMLTGCSKAGQTQSGMGQGVTNRTLVEGPWKGPP